MKTANKLFYAQSLLASVKALYELADAARWEAEKAANDYITCRKNKEDAASVRSAFDKMNKLSAVFGEASRKAYDAEVRYFYANR